MDEDTLTLEELEEQQRLIWAALEQAESTHSDSDIPAGTPLAGNSVTSSPSRTEPSVPLEEAAPKNLDVPEPELYDNPEQIPRAEEPDHTPTSAIELVDLTVEEQHDPVDSEGKAQTPSSAPAGGVNHSDAPAVPSARLPSKTASPVPDMSKFAAGITPFEFDNMTESTGTYLRIRRVLKNSPRNQQKNKKAPL